MKKNFQFKSYKRILTQKVTISKSDVSQLSEIQIKHQMALKNAAILKSIEELVDDVLKNS